VAPDGCAQAPAAATPGRAQAPVAATPGRAQAPAPMALDGRAQFPRAGGARRPRRRASLRPQRGLQRRDQPTAGCSWPPPNDSARPPRPASPACGPLVPNAAHTGSVVNIVVVTELSRLLVDGH